MHVLISVFLLILVMPVQAELYRWTDAEGNTVFGDRPPQHLQRRAERVRLQDPGDAASDEALFRERERRLLRAMARDRAERGRLLEQSRDQAGRAAQLRGRCSALREEHAQLGRAETSEAAEPVGDRAERLANLAHLLAAHCEEDG